MKMKTSLDIDLSVAGNPTPGMLLLVTSMMREAVWSQEVHRPVVLFEDEAEARGTVQQSGFIIGGMRL